MEVAPILLWTPLLIILYTKKLRLTELVYFLVFVHGLILMLGGHYTYAEVPIGNWIKDLFALSRNHYDRVGHLAQGFIPALVIREILIRFVRIKRGVGSFYWSPRSPFRSAPVTNLSNGGQPSFLDKGQKLFWERKAMSGIRNGICFLL